MQSTQTFYDEYWAGKGGWRPAPALGRAHARVLERWFAQPGPLVDVGCGAGSPFAHWLAERGHEYVGLDVSREAVVEAERAGLTARVHDLSQPLPFPDGALAGVTCFEVLEHLFDPEPVVREAFRVMRPGGRFLVTVPNVAKLENRIAVLRGHWRPGGSPLTSWDAPWRDPHIRFFTAASLRKLLTGCGFLLRELTGDGGTGVLGALGARFPALFAGHLIAVAERPGTGEEVR